MRTTTDAGHRRRGQRGVALILVLWTFAALSVLAAEFARAMHDEAASTRNFKESTQARFVAIAAVNEVILALQAYKENRDSRIEEVEDPDDPDPVQALSRGDGRWIAWKFRGTPYEVRVIDEAGKIALNQVDGTVLREILTNLDVSDDDAEVIADSIIDWRDEDDFHGPNGAETDYYESLPRPYRAKNAGFDAVEELLLVRGVTQEIFYGSEGYPGLVDIFSVFNQSRTINLRSVTPEVMQALGGFDQEEAREFGASRRRDNTDSVINELRSSLTGSGVSGRNSTPQQVTIEARVRDASGRVILAHLGAVLNFSSGGDGLRVYRWYDSIFDDSDETGGVSDAGAAG